MNNAQKGSVHRQFYSSPHRQRIIQMAVASGILVERIYGDITSPIAPDFSGLPDYSIFTYVDGNNVGTRKETGVLDYREFTIESPTIWTTPSLPYGISAWTADGSGEYTGLGVGCFNGVFGKLAKMRVHYPASGYAGFYYVYNNSTANCVLQSSQRINPTSGYVDLLPPYPTKGPSSETGWSICMFFFGIDEEADIPTEISNLAVTTSTPIIFP